MSEEQHPLAPDQKRVGWLLWVARAALWATSCTGGVGRPPLQTSKIKMQPPRFPRRLRHTQLTADPRLAAGPGVYGSMLVSQYAASLQGTSLRHPGMKCFTPPRTVL